MEKEAQFLIDNGLYKQDQLELVKGLLEGHLQHNTLLVLKDFRGIYAICRWNMDTVDVAHIIDVAVRKDKRYRNILVKLINEGLKCFPLAKYLRFKRGFKHKKLKLIPINRFKENKDVTN